MASNWGIVYRQWTLRDAGGTSALLYVGVTGKVQTMLYWSGELGYQGEGYQVQTRSVQTLQLRSGGTTRVSVVQVQRLAVRRVLEYAVVRPDGIAASGTDNLLRTGWEVVQGTAGPYYLVRVSVSADAQDRTGQRAAAQLLGSVLSVLQAKAHTS